MIDDNANDRRLQSDYLQAQGWRLYMAENGLDGVEKARMVLPDLILMDIVMPVCDGMAACRLLKADPRTSIIPLMFLTAAAQPDERVQGLIAGAVDYITKPFNFDELRLRISIHLQAWLQPQNSQLEDCVALGDASSVDAMVFRAALRILHSDFATPPDLAGLARAVGTNSRRLNEAFRNCKGVTVFDYLREVRMEEARKLLRETNLAVNVIAQWTSPGLHPLLKTNFSIQSPDFFDCLELAHTRSAASRLNISKANFCEIEWEVFEWPLSGDQLMSRCLRNLVDLYRYASAVDRQLKTEGGCTACGFSRTRPHVNRPATAASPLSFPSLNSCPTKTSWCTTYAFAQALHLSQNDFRKPQFCLSKE